MAGIKLDWTDTIAALATSSGGAIGIIRISGKDAFNIINQLFPSKDLQQQPSHTLHVGYLKDKEEILDEVVVSLFKAPRSYTGEDVIEISCHGSYYVQEKILNAVTKYGARVAKPGEFTQRAFLNGKIDLTQAEAVADLIAADSAAAHKTALQQMKGGFSSELKKLREDLIHFASLLELELDFSEEDVEFANKQQLKLWLNNVLQIVKALTDSFRWGNVIKKGVTTVIAGRPNAGKSTLINALLNEERAIVSEIAGTTRDTIEEVLIINGIAFRLIDTAGIRETTDALEVIGVERTLEKVKAATVLLYVYDITNTAPEEAREDILLLLKMNNNTSLIVVANKLDLNPKYSFFVLPQYMNDPEIRVSSKNAEDIENLKQVLWQTAGIDYTADQSVLTSSRHYEALVHITESLQHVLKGLEDGLASDLLATDIRTALHHLGEITGEVTTEHLLDNIFSKFCIGK